LVLPQRKVLQARLDRPVLRAPLQLLLVLRALQDRLGQLDRKELQVRLVRLGLRESRVQLDLLGLKEFKALQVRLVRKAYRE
jgi:hypothetical protein